MKQIFYWLTGIMALVVPVTGLASLHIGLPAWYAGFVIILPIMVGMGAIIESIDGLAEVMRERSK